MNKPIEINGRYAPEDWHKLFNANASAISSKTMEDSQYFVLSAAFEAICAAHGKDKALEAAHWALSYWRGEPIPYVEPA